MRWDIKENFGFVREGGNLVKMALQICENL